MEVSIETTLARVYDVDPEELDGVAAAHRVPRRGGVVRLRLREWGCRDRCQQVVGEVRLHIQRGRMVEDPVRVGNHVAEEVVRRRKDHAEQGLVARSAVVVVGQQVDDVAQRHVQLIRAAHDGLPEHFGQVDIVAAGLQCRGSRG